MNPIELILMKCAECGGITGCEFATSTQIARSLCEICLFKTDCAVKRAQIVFKTHTCVCHDCHKEAMR